MSSCHGNMEFRARHVIPVVSGSVSAKVAKFIDICFNVQNGTNFLSLWEKIVFPDPVLSIRTWQHQIRCHDSLPAFLIRKRTGY